MWPCTEQIARLYPQFFLEMNSRLLSKFQNSLVNEDYKSHLCNNNIILNAAFVVSLVLISFPFAISVVRHQKAPVQWAGGKTWLFMLWHSTETCFWIKLCKEKSSTTEVHFSIQFPSVERNLLFYAQGGRLWLQNTPRRAWLYLW